MPEKVSGLLDYSNIGIKTRGASGSKRKPYCLVRERKVLRKKEVFETDFETWVDGLKLA